MKSIELFYGKKGLEIGGPSLRYAEILQLYDNVTLDGVNFSFTTVWEGQLLEGETYKYGNKIGHQYILEATDLYRIGAKAYDFVLSCNNLEHIANPLKAMKEWLRVLKPGGLMFLVLPKKESNFDHNREVTKMDHLVMDFENDISEHDLSHLEEILLLHDLPLDPWAGDRENFIRRSKANFENRCLHQHIFDMELLEQIFIYFKIEVIEKETIPTDYFIIGRK
jgi:SAM-dependent methyltransferase